MKWTVRILRYPKSTDVVKPTGEKTVSLHSLVTMKECNGKNYLKD
jgi:hypothetical protein